ncbi:MAG: TetR/AcrR family transcriptional regulator [Gemmatimonadales bacterium]
MPRKQPEDRPYHWGEKLRSDLIAEAVRQVEPWGMGRLSTREVAKVVGVSHAAPNHYFANRLALAAAVAGVGFERMYDAITVAVTDARNRPSEQLLAACIAYIDFALKNPGLYRTMYAADLAERLNDSPRGMRQGTDWFSNLSQLKARVFGLFVELVRDGQSRDVFRRGKPDDVARVATALSHGLAREFLDEELGSRIDRIAHAKQVLGVMLTGIEIR